MKKHLPAWREQKIFDEIGKMRYDRGEIDFLTAQMDKTDSKSCKL